MRISASEKHDALAFQARFIYALMNENVHRGTLL